jgi:hypothetical protein
MKKIIALGMFCLLLAPAALAQIRIEVLLDQEQYLPKETMPTKVRIHNLSGRALNFGKDPDWLTFSIETETGQIVKQINTPTTLGEFTLPSASRATKTIDLAPVFDLTKIGSYLITASVKIPGWDQAFQNPKPKKFYIMNGRNLQELTFGVPSDDKGRPEIRKFILVEANHLKHISLYVRITDENEQETIKLFPIGELISFSHPVAQLDAWSNLHLLYQSSGKSFRYTVITPDGLLLTRHTYDYTETRPTMAAAADGRIAVTGGFRRVTSADLPPPDSLTEAENTGTETLPDNVLKPADVKKFP